MLPVAPVWQRHLNRVHEGSTLPCVVLLRSLSFHCSAYLSVHLLLWHRFRKRIPPCLCPFLCLHGSAKFERSPCLGLNHLYNTTVLEEIPLEYVGLLSTELICSLMCWYEYRLDTEDSSDDSSDFDSQLIMILLISTLN